MGVISGGWASLNVGCALGDADLAASAAVSLGAPELPESRIVQSSAWLRAFSEHTSPGVFPKSTFPSADLTRPSNMASDTTHTLS